MSECRNPRCENVSEYELCDECFDALLMERGYEKRMAENDSGRVYYVAPKDDIAEEVHTTPIYVPLQRDPE